MKAEVDLSNSETNAYLKDETAVDRLKFTKKVDL